MELLVKWRGEIASGRVRVMFLDECHLRGTKIIGTKNRNKEMGRCLTMYIHGEVEEESINNQLSLRVKSRLRGSAKDVRIEQSQSSL